MSKAKIFSTFDGLNLKENNQKIIIKGTTFKFTLSKANGLINGIEIFGNQFLSTGSYLPDLYLSNGIDPKNNLYEARYETQAKCEIISRSSQQIIIKSEGSYFNRKKIAFPMHYILTYILDFDGTLTVKVVNKAATNGNLRWLCFSKASVNKDLCKFLAYENDFLNNEGTCHPIAKLISNSKGQLMAGRFIPWFHLGNDASGLDVVISNASNMSYGWTDSSPYKTGDALGEPGKMMILESEGKKITWQFFSIRNLFTIIHPHWQRENTFYLSAVPGKKYSPEFSNLRVHWEGPHQFNPHYEYPSDEKIKELARTGINLIVGCANWRSGKYSAVDNEKETKRVIATCHKYNIKIIPYVTFTDLNHQTKAFLEHGEEWQIEPVAEFKYITNLMCYGAKGWREYWKKEIETILQRFDFDGLYIDLWSAKMFCRNEQHGCHKKYGNFTLPGIRQMALYAYKVVKSKNPHYFILANTNIFPCAMLNNFVDIRLLGEWENVEQTSPLVKRIFYNAHRLGCNSLLIPWKISSITEKSVNFSLSCQAPMIISRSKGEDLKGADLLLHFAHILRFFDINKAECFDSFNNSSIIRTNPDYLSVTVYKNKEKEILITAANQLDKEIEASLQILNIDKLDIENGKFYLAYQPYKEKLWQELPFKGTNLSKPFKLRLTSYSPFILFITELPQTPSLLYALNADSQVEQNWDKSSQTLSLILKGVKNALVKVTVYSSLFSLKEIVINDKKVDFNLTGKLISFLAPCESLVCLKF